MKRLTGMALAAALALSLGACGGGDQQTQPPANNNQQQPADQGQGGGNAPAGGGNTAYDAAAAEATYRNSCAGCHGQNLEGTVGPNLTQVGGKYSRDEILQILNQGKGQMPGGLVQGTDAENLAAWLADKK